MTGRPCAECGSRDHRLSSGKEAYPHRADLLLKPFWFCVCGAFVGCHPGTSLALGSPAGPRTRAARQAAHEAFDPIWKDGTLSRSEAYSELSSRLGIRPVDCHFGSMDAETARKAAQVAYSFRQELKQE